MFKQVLTKNMHVPEDLASELMETWEAQQNCHIRFREERFTVMFDVAGEAFGPSLKLLDIASGPGSLTRRMLDRFPEANVTAVDYDPVLLAIGRKVLSKCTDKIEWVEGDLSRDEWHKSLNKEYYDTAMSTTALHWLNEDGLKNLYSNIYGLLRKGGIFMNGDHMIKGDNQKEIFKIIHDANEKWSDSAFRTSRAMDWDKWWLHLAEYKEFDDLLQVRSERYSKPNDHNQMVSLDKHMQFLREAGFRMVDVIWQYSNDRILLAMK